MMVTVDCLNCGSEMTVGAACEECGHIDGDGSCDCRTCQQQGGAQMYCPRCHELVSVRTEKMGRTFTEYLCRECNAVVAKTLD